MTLPFIMKSIPRIEFGTGALGSLPAHIERYGSRLLLVAGGHSFTDSNHCRKLLDTLEKKGVSVKMARVEGEPSPALVNAITERYFDRGIEVVTAIGGGAVLDAGKALAAMLIEGGDVTRFLEGVGTETPGGNRLPFIAVPTTSGTGSEATANAVLSSVGPGGFKKSLRHPSYIPDLALVDPALTLSCPPRLTAFAAMDCFSQLVEAFLSTHASDFTDSLALEGIRTLSRSIRTVVYEGQNIEARSNLACAALLSGIVLANAGLGTVHGFASAAGGLFPLPHGLVCGALMAPANALTLIRLRELPENSERKTALEKYATLGSIFAGREGHGKSAAWKQDFFIEEVKRLSREFQLPSFRDYGVAEEDIPAIVSGAGNKYNPVQFDTDELSTILEHCL